MGHIYNWFHIALFSLIFGWLCAAFRTFSALLEILGSALHQLQIDETEFEARLCSMKSYNFISLRLAEEDPFKCLIPLSDKAFFK